jgi:hypothetical protein
MIIYHIFTRNLVSIKSLKIEEIIKGIRPDIPNDVPKFLKEIISNCWEGERKNRNDISLIESKFKENFLKFNEEKQKLLELEENSKKIIVEEKLSPVTSFKIATSYEAITYLIPNNYEDSSQTCDNCRFCIKIGRSFWHCKECSNYDLCEKCKNVVKFEHKHKKLTQFSGKSIPHLADNDICCKECLKKDFEYYFYLKKDHILCPDCYSKKNCPNNDYICCKRIDFEKENIKSLNFLLNLKFNFNFNLFLFLKF